MCKHLVSFLTIQVGRKTRVEFCSQRSGLAKSTAHWNWQNPALCKNWLFSHKELSFLNTEMVVTVGFLSSSPAWRPVPPPKSPPHCFCRAPPSLSGPLVGITEVPAIFLVSIGLSHVSLGCRQLCSCLISLLNCEEKISSFWRKDIIYFINTLTQSLSPPRCSLSGYWMCNWVRGGWYHCQHRSGARL